MATGSLLYGTSAHLSYEVSTGHLRHFDPLGVGGPGYVFGGTGSDTPGGSGSSLQDCDSFGPSSNSWANKTSVPSAVIGAPAAFAISSKGYVYGGGGGSPSTSLSRYCEEYDATGDSWTTKSMTSPLKMSNSADFVVGVQGYATDYNKCYEYTPSTNTWATKANLPSSKSSFPEGFGIGSKGYICIGSGVNAVRTYEYTPSTNTWATKASTSSSSGGGSSSFVIGLKGYIQAYSSFNYEYTQATNTWASKTTAPSTQGGVSGASTISSKGYLYGGNPLTGGYGRHCGEYNGTTDSWSSKMGLPLPYRYYSSAATL